MFDLIFTIVRYACSLVFGIVLTAALTNVLRTKKDIGRIILIFLSIGAVQLIFFIFLGFEKTQAWYPVHTHLFLILILVIVFKVKALAATISTLIAYMCCLIPSLLSRLAMYLPFGKPFTELILYILSVSILLFALLKYVVRPMRDVICGSIGSALTLAIVPFIYYVFDFITNVWSDWIYSGNYHVVQFMPFVACCAHLVFICIYNNEQRLRLDTIRDKDNIENRLKVVEVELSSLTHMQEMTRLYRHDIRHHLSYLLQLADEGNLDAIKTYIRENVDAIDSITPRHFCDHEMLNLLLSHAADIAEKNKVKYNFRIMLPEKIPLTPPELCSLVSNALENAMNALRKIPPEDRVLDIKIKEINRMLVFSVDNTCSNDISIVDGVPFTPEQDHGYGTRSIIAIARMHGGFADFSIDGNTFKLLISLSMDQTTTAERK